LKTSADIADDSVVLVDTQGRPAGRASRRDVHGNPDLLHGVVHVLIRDGRGRYLLQKRSSDKDIAPGMWDTSVGGHMAPGEDPETAARREMAEELGISDRIPLQFRGVHIYRDDRESEFVTTFLCTYTGRLHPDPDEVAEVRAFSLDEIRANRGRGFFTNHFERQMDELLDTRR